MKNSVFLFLLLASFTFITTKSIKAQNPAFEPGSNVINIGIGMWGPYYYNGAYYNRSYSIPNISVSLDHGLNTKAGPGTLALGGIVAVRGFHYKQLAYSGTYPLVVYDEHRWTDFFVAGRLTYHLGLKGNDKFDFYPGISLGVVISNYSLVHPLIYQYSTPPYYWYQNGEISSRGSGVYPAAGLFLGFRYNFTEKVGIFTEFGWEFTAFKLGVAIKF